MTRERTEVAWIVAVVLWSMVLTIFGPWVEAHTGLLWLAIVLQAFPILGLARLLQR